MVLGVRCHSRPEDLIIPKIHARDRSNFRFRGRCRAGSMSAVSPRKYFVQEPQAARSYCAWSSVVVIRCGCGRAMSYARNWGGIY